MPTATGKPWPSGPVLVSTPGTLLRSGWPLRRESGCEEGVQLGLVEVAGHGQRGVQRRGRVALAEDEAIALGVVRVGGVVAEHAAEEERDQDVDGAENSPPMCPSSARWTISRSRRRTSMARWRSAFVMSAVSVATDGSLLRSRSLGRRVVSAPEVAAYLRRDPVSSEWPFISVWTLHSIGMHPRICQGATAYSGAAVA